MRTYLVVIDETDEARTALRFASRRASKTGGAVHILALVEQADFVAWGGLIIAVISEVCPNEVSTSFDEYPEWMFIANLC